MLGSDMSARPLIPRRKLFGNPTFFGPKLSPDGRHIMFLNDENGDENLHLFVVDPASCELRDLTPLRQHSRDTDILVARHPRQNRDQPQRPRSALA
jgi:hypothetical protein